VILASDLQRAIDIALAALNGSENSDLRLDDRRDIYSFFDALPGRQGRIARTAAALRVARRVLPVWDGMPSEAGYLTMPGLMLATADQLLAALKSGLTGDEIKTLAQSITVTVSAEPPAGREEPIVYTAYHLSALAVEMAGFTWEGPSSLYYHEWCVFLASMTALHEALGLGWWKWAQTNDAVGYAALSYAPGTWTAFEDQNPAYFVPQGNWDYTGPETLAKRHEFWEWWCREVVPWSWEASTSMI
jgi:hypothetical protein